MAITIQQLTDQYRSGRDGYADSIDEMDLLERYYKGEYYTEEESCSIESKDLVPSMTNVVAEYTNKLSGIFSRMYNTVKVTPNSADNDVQTQLLNYIIHKIDNSNNVQSSTSITRKSMLLHGIACHQMHVYPAVNLDGTNKVDSVGRIEYTVEKESIDPREITLDPSSTKYDYSDANFIIRSRFMTTQDLEDKFGKRKVSSFQDSTMMPDGESLENTYDISTLGDKQDRFMVHNTYYKDKGNVWSVWWTEHGIITQHKVKNSNRMLPITVVKLQDANSPEFYGIFHSSLSTINVLKKLHIESQYSLASDAILIDPSAFATAGGNTGGARNLGNTGMGNNPSNSPIDTTVEDIMKDTMSNISKPKSVTIVQNPNSTVRVLDKSTDYIHIEKKIHALETAIKNNIGLTESLMGLAQASDSGIKVRQQILQAMQSISYIDIRFKAFYEKVGEELIRTVIRYYHSHRVMNITLDNGEQKIIDVNVPLVDLVHGTPLMETIINEETGEPVRDKRGAVVRKAYNNHYTDISYASTDFEVHSTLASDMGEEEYELLNESMGGQAGQILAQTSPVDFLELEAMKINLKNTPTARVIADKFVKIAQKMEQAQAEAEAQMQAQMQAQPEGGM